MPFGTVVGVATPLITFVLLTAVGLELRPPDFRRVFGRPRLVAAGLVVPPLLLPLLALALTRVFDPPPAIASGLLLVAICPVGGISNTFTYLARGSTALSVTLTATSCVLAIATIPALGALVGRVAHTPPVGQLPTGLLLAQLLATVVLPVCVGMGVRRLRPDLADAHHASLRRVAFGLLALLLALIVAADPSAFITGLPVAVPLAAGFVAGSVLVGGGVAHALGGDFRDRVALAIEFATRNVAVANMLALSQGQLGFATFATTYFLTELPVMGLAVAIFRWVGVRTAAAAAWPGLGNR
jgi:BASS family bile acid:Na+ symporter